MIYKPGVESGGALRSSNRKARRNAAKFNEICEIKIQNLRNRHLVAFFLIVVYVNLVHVIVRCDSM